MMIATNISAFHHIDPLVLTKIGVELMLILTECFS